MNVLELFSGACGAWSLGLERAGMRIVAACEIDPWRRATYATNFPGARLYDDVCTLTAERLRADGVPAIDVLAASFPCQDASSANWYGRGVDGDRTGLVSEWLRLLRELRPGWGLAENVRRLVHRGADRIIGDLGAIRYACWPLVMGAEDFGADHERKRLFFVCADADQNREHRVSVDGEVARVVGPHPWAEPWSEAAPRFHRVADGVSSRLANEARAAYGDSFPPIIAQAIGVAIVSRGVQ
jgi:DNA (cytosine-5)-methyltransferase 1